MSHIIAVIVYISPSAAGPATTLYLPKRSAASITINCGLKKKSKANRKRGAVMAGNHEKLCCPKAARKETEAKNNYRENTGAKMGKNSVKEEWNVIKHMTDSSNPASSVQEDLEFSTELDLLLDRPLCAQTVCLGLHPSSLPPPPPPMFFMHG